MSGQSKPPPGTTRCERCGKEHLYTQPHRCSDEIVGAVLNGKHQVIERIGQGGMGAVYKARHLTLDTNVALKVLLKDDDDEAKKRFLFEARVASKIRHPNTVYISDFGELPDGRAFLEMEFLEGRTLGQELRKGPMEPLRACQIAVQIARGLGAVHEKSIVHRDMKPDNVFLLEQDGTPDFVKLVDFGIAKRTRRGNTPNEGGPSSDPGAARVTGSTSGLGTSSNRLTMVGNVIGTPGYMAPEQMEGGPLDFRVDQYAFGCILYQMLSGREVFAAPTQQALMMRHMTAEPESLRTARPEARVSIALDKLVLRLLSKEAGQRFASMRAVEAELQAEIDRLQNRTLPVGFNLPSGARNALRIRGRSFPLSRVLPIAFAVLAGAGFVGYRLLQKPTESLSAILPRELLELREQALSVLREDVRSGSEELKESALTALGHSRFPELRKDLETILAKPEPSTQAQAAAALGALGDRQAIPALVAAFEKAANPTVKSAAAGALRDLGEPRGQRYLEQALDTKDAEVQFRTALSFCGEGPKDAQRVLRVYSQRKGLPEPTLINILTCLARAGDTSSRELLRTQFLPSGPKELRMLAAVKLALLGDADGLRYLRELTKKRDPDQLVAARQLALLDENDGLPLFQKIAPSATAQSVARQLSCDGLGAVGEAADARLLKPLLGDPTDPALRQAAARAVLYIASRDPALLSAQSMGWAKTALGDSDALVRQSAAEVLGDSVNAGAVSLLASLLSDRDTQVRQSAIAALGRRRDAAAVSALTGALADSDRTVRSAALRSLLQLGDYLKSEAVAKNSATLRSALTELIKQGAVPERELSAGVLLRMGDTSQLPAMQSALSSPDPEVRRIALLQLPLTADQLAERLTDGVPALRFLAARRLAEQKDSRGIAALREAIERGGAEAIEAYALLKRLAQTVATPPDFEALVTASDVSQRMKAVEALARLEPEQAEPFVARAARDLDPRVRRLAAETAGELAARPGGATLLGAILRRLSADANASVRARAAAILARLKLPPGSESVPTAKTPLVDEVPPGKPETPKSVSTTPPDGGSATSPSGPATSPPAPAGTGTLLVEGQPGVQFQLDKRPWQAVNNRPIAVEAGPHTLNFLSGQKPVKLTDGQTLRVQIPTSQVEQLSRGGLDSYAKKDFKRALSQLNKALSLCSRDRVHAAACTTLSFELLCRVGSIYEQQREYEPAMRSYQRALAVSVQAKGKPELKTEAQDAVTRLSQNLGQLIVKKRGPKGCSTEILWLRPGIHQIRVDTKFEQIEIKRRDEKQVGTCN